MVALEGEKDRLEFIKQAYVRTLYYRLDHSEGNCLYPSRVDVGGLRLGAHDLCPLSIEEAMS